MSLRPIVAASLKAYFGHEDTLRWVRSIRDGSLPWLEGIDVIVIPMATALAEAAAILRGSGILVGAQDCSVAPPGPYTGEVPAAVLRELGVAVVELGHAERRRLFGEDDAVVARKAASAVTAGIVPMVCVGEPTEGPPSEAAAVCLAQVHAALEEVSATEPVVIAYEPVWAIGASAPASPSHIRPVCQAIQEDLRRRGEGSRVIYGGTAGPGLFESVQPDVDGLFLGRRAHDPAAFTAVLREVERHMHDRSTDRASGLELTR